MLNRNQLISGALMTVLSIRKLFVCIVVCLFNSGALPAAAVELGEIMQVNLARTSAARGDYASAISVLEDEISRESFNNDEELAALLADVAEYSVLDGRFIKGAETYVALAETVARFKGRISPDLSTIYESAAMAYWDAGNPDDALTYLERALQIDRRYLPCGSEILAQSLSDLSDLNEKLGRIDEAVRLRSLAKDEDLRCADKDYNSPVQNTIVGDRERKTAKNGFTQISVYYATDRARTGSTRPDTFYGGQRGKLEFGALDITVPKSHKPGNVEIPSLVLFEWSQNPDKHIIIKRLETLSRSELATRMRRTLSASGSDEAFVFVHGYNVTFADAAKRTAQIAYDLNFEGIPFVYSWPSLGNPFGYISDEAVVRLGGRRLMTILDSLSAKTGIRRIHLIAHSMGSRALADALELMAMRGSGKPAIDPPFEQVLFAAPDIDIDLFADMSRRFRPLTRRLTLYASDRDAALETSRSLHGEMTRAGEAGEDMLVDNSLDTIDMSELGDGILGHSYFANNPSALSDMLWLFWRDDHPAKRCGMKERPGNMGSHWRYDTTRCDGSVALSAISLLRSHGSVALEHALSQVNQNSENDTAQKGEWQAIADVIRSALGN